MIKRGNRAPRGQSRAASSAMKTTKRGTARTAIRRRRLLFRNHATGATNEVPIPFGFHLDLNIHRVFIQRTRDRSEQICAESLRGAGNLPAAIISPVYAAQDELAGSVGGMKIKVRLWTVVTDLDRLRAREVVQREHYLSDPGQGMILACAFEDPKVQEKLRNRPASTNAKEKVSWYLPSGGITACAFLSEMWHGNPKEGRQLIATQLGLSDSWRTWTRPEVMKRLRVAWGSRFAVDEPYQGLGIGTILARHLKIVARRYRLPQSDFLEVITTEERVAGEAAPTLGGGFLIKAGYTVLGTPLKSDSMQVMDFETGFRRPEPAIKRYYYADLRSI